MDRLARANVVAKSGRAVEAAGDVDVLLLDKTGTITFGNRMADARIPAQGVSPAALARAALGASRADDTPEGKSIVEIARKQPGAAEGLAEVAEAIAFSAQTRLSGADLTDGTQLRKGSVDAILRHTGAALDASLAASVDQIARSGGTPLLVSEGPRILGAVHLKDIIKPGVRERFLADPLLIEQVVMNLLDNAAKYAPEGSAITVAAAIKGIEAELSVSDTGPGIPADARARVFDMFYRVAEGDGQRAGTGLGLAITRGIVEAHGGRIKAEPSQPGGTGTRIALTLPLANPDAPA